MNENEDTSMDEYINYDIKSVDCQDSSLDDDYWRGSMYVKEDDENDRNDAEASCNCTRY